MKILLLINEFFDYLENKILSEEELTKEEKEKLKNVFLEISNEWKKWKDAKFIGTIKGREKEAKLLIKNLMVKASKIKPSMEKLKTLTKNGLTSSEEEDLKTWDYCEKMLTVLQNKMAKSNIELKKTNNTSNITYNPDWKDSCFNSVKTNYFNY